MLFRKSFGLSKGRLFHMTEAAAAHVPGASDKQVHCHIFLLQRASNVRHMTAFRASSSPRSSSSLSFARLVNLLHLILINDCTFNFIFKYLFDEFLCAFTKEIDSRFLSCVFFFFSRYRRRWLWSLRASILVRWLVFLAFLVATTPQSGEKSAHENRRQKFRRQIHLSFLFILHKDSLSLWFSHLHIRVPSIHRMWLENALKTM